MKLNINNRLDPITQQCDWATRWDNAQRVASIAMPWLALNSKCSAAMTVGNGLLTASVHVKQLKICLTNDNSKARDLLDPGFKLIVCISQIGLQIFSPKLMGIAQAASHGYQIIILTKDGIAYAIDGNLGEAGLCGYKAISSGLYIGSTIYGGHALLALSLAAQATSELLFAYSLINQSSASKLDYVEALSNSLLGTMRMHQASSHAKTFYRNKFGEHLTQRDVAKLFSALEKDRRSANQQDLNCLWHDQDRFEFEQYLKEKNISSELENLDFGKLSYIEDVAFNHLEFTKCSFDGLEMSNCSFDHARLSQSTFLGFWGESNQFKNTEFDHCVIKNARMLNTIWEKTSFENTIISRSALTDSTFKNVRFLSTDVRESYLNGSQFINTTFDKCDLYASTFFRANAKNSKFIDSKLIDTLLCESGNEFRMLGNTVHEITKPVIAYSTNPYCILDWGDLDDPLLESIRRAGALVLIFDHEPNEINGQNLRNEIQTALPILKPHQEKSIPIQLFEKAEPGSEVAKVQELTHNVLKWCDGVCIPGGSDVDPSLYGKKNNFEWSFYEQDMMEAGAVYEAMQSKKPIVGICRGAQLTAVVGGGTLKNVNGQLGYKTFERTPKEGTKEYQLFEEIYGDHEIAGINAHSQAIDRVPNGFTVLAQIDDIPKLTTNEDGSILLSQFHPENYVNMQVEVDWDYIFQKFAHSPTLIAKIKAFIGNRQMPVQKDIDRWKHFFDFYVSKAKNYQQSKTRIAAAA